jgi:hypothetical protein
MSSKTKLEIVPQPQDAITSLEADSLALALRHAYEPKPLANERNETLLSRALGVDLDATEADDLFALPTPEEREQAELLAHALDDRGNRNHPLAILATDLKHAYAPEALSPIKLEQIARSITRRTPRYAWTKPATGVAFALALAAAFALIWLPRQRLTSGVQLVRSEPSSQRTFYIGSRSLSPLFAEQSTPGSTTERMDRIVDARSRDLRHNRYLTWRGR